MPWWLASSSPLPSRVFFYGIPTWLLLLASCICIFIHDTPGVLALASVFIGWLVGRLALTTYLIMIYISRHCLEKKDLPSYLLCIGSRGGKNLPIEPSV